MFKKKDNNTLKVSGKISKNQADSLALLIARMQKNADQVEKNVLRAEELLAVDSENEKNELPFKHQKENSDNLAQAEGLLKDLFLDVDKAKKLKHPQGSEIESDVHLLHDRWLKDCNFYREVYEQLDDVELKPRIDWAPVLNQKQKEVNSEEYGPTMSDLEKQIAAHNILHRQIEAYSSQLSASSTGTKEEYAAIKKQYSNLLDNSKWRRHYLSSLYDYMQGCTKELSYLGDEQKKILKQDWSDRMEDPPAVRRQYENFKSNSLLAHETEVNKLQDDGDRLIELKHPASATIQAQRDALRNEWQEFLNLCICQETHLDNVEDFQKYQLDTETLSESLTKLNSSLDPKLLDKKSNTEKLMQLEAQEGTLQRGEQLLADLRKRSTTIAPLKQRRTPPTRPVTVESLCDWDTDKDSLSRGDIFTLKSNADLEKWNVVASDGATKTFPGACFLIPPPDPEAIDKVDLLGTEITAIKKKRAALQASLKSPNTEGMRAQQSGNAPVSFAPLNPKAQALAGQLDKLNGDLDKTQQDMLNRLRVPLDRSDPTGDLNKRLKEQEKTAQALKALDQKKAATQLEMAPLLSESNGPTSSALPLKLSAAQNKQDGLAALADLYTKKANASLNLEGQIKKVDGIVSGFEEKLSNDGVIPDSPNSIETRTKKIQGLRKEVAGSQDDIKKLGEDLEATEKLCSSLQQGYQEYCPDISRQRTQVKNLQNRYASVNNQLKDREILLQEAAIKNQELQSTSKSLNSFLDNLPKNQISPGDDLAQVNAKKSSQERVMEDLSRKGDDLDRAVDLSQDLQNVLNEYEANADRYGSTLARAPNAKKPQVSTLTDAVLKQEKDLVNRYAEASAENSQRLNQMGLARNLIGQNEEKVQLVSQQQVQRNSQQRSVDNIDGLKKELNEEVDRCTHAETDLKSYKTRLLSLKSRRGVERVEEKEVLQYYRDPKLESDLKDLRNKMHEEAMKRSSTQGEIEIINRKITTLQENVKDTPPKLVTREVTEFEKDPQLDKDAAKLRDEINHMKGKVRGKDEETIQMKTEVTILQAKRPTIKEKVVKKEVVKIEKSPEMVQAVRTFQTEIADESTKSKAINDEIFQTRSQINALERIIPTIQPKVVTKEIKKIEQDPQLIKEVKVVKSSIEEEIIENTTLAKELSSLQSRYNEVQTWKPKVDVKEIVNEIYRIDPATSVEITRLKKELNDTSKQRSDMEKQISIVMIDLDALRLQKPKVEIKEVTQEVVKEERSPENEKEIQKLNDQVNQLHRTYISVQDQVSLLRKERDEWKVEKSRVETKLVTREVIKYENDPLLEKEADRLRKELSDETRLRRTFEEMVYDMQNNYIQLERQKPEEKVVVQEVVRLQKDPRQLVEHDKLSRNLDEEIKSRRQMDLELQQLKSMVVDKERILRESDEHQKRIQVESELRQIKLRITELENAPPPVEENIVIEEVLKVEREPKLERMTNGLRTDLEKESNDIFRLQRDIRNINVRLEILQREKSGERTVYKEVVRVEKDQAVEAERDRLREQVSQEKFGRQDLEDQIQRLSSKVNLLRNTNSGTSREETTLVLSRDALQRDKDNLTRELKTLEAERQNASLMFQQQTRLMSEKTQMSRQKSMKVESDVQRLERDILNEKDQIHARDSMLRELIQNLDKEDNAETRTRETNVSTKITILDPDTGKDMSPYDAYLQGLIDRAQYMHLQELECDWEEITSRGPDGENSVLQDRKSGRQYSIIKALKEGTLTQSDLQKYKDGKMPISEFALLVAGEKNKQPNFNSIVPKSTSLVKSSPLKPTHVDADTKPIAGVLDTNTDTCFSIRSATMRRLIDNTTAQRLLEAQAATGGIIEISTKERLSVHKAADRGLIDSSQLQRLLNAQKAFTGVEDPMTKERLSVGEAVQKGWMPKESAMRYMEAQHLTGGLVNPISSDRVDIVDAVAAKMIDSSMMRELQSEMYYGKEIVDPLTKEKINYKQAMDRSKIDPMSGLLMLPGSSKDSGYTPTYTPHRYSRY